MKLLGKNNESPTNLIHSDNVYSIYENEFARETDWILKNKKETNKKGKLKAALTLHCKIKLMTQ